MNIRDISMFNEKIKPSLIYRSNEVVSIDDLEILKAQKIQNIFDFRCNYEIKINEYSKILPAGIKYFNMPIETHPAEKLYQGTPMESVYQYFAYDCKELFATILKKLLIIKGSVLFSCRFGMDRTGILITILHLFCNTPIDKIKEDYLKSGGIMVEKHLDIFLSVIYQYDSISDYFSNELSNIEIKQLKLKLLKS